MRFASIPTRRPSRLPRLALLALIGLAIGSAGCGRSFFRQRADREVSEVLQEKDRFADWKIEHFHVYPDPRARFAQEANADYPTMPADDPAAKLSGPNPQRPKKGPAAPVESTGYLELLRAWDAENRGTPLDKPSAKLGSPRDLGTAQATHHERHSPYHELVPAQYTLPAPQPLDEPRPFLIKLEQAVEIGLVNSREFQNRREDLYLTALPVTLERYAFAAQFFFLEDAIRERTGSQSVSGAHNRWVNNASTGFTKLFSTGALLLFRFANQAVFELSGTGRHTTSVSALNLDLVQPFLRGGGRAVTLEPLTQVERNLLYEIRSYARFRKEFFNSIAGGGDLSADAAFFGRTGGTAVVPGAVVAAAAARPALTPGGSGRIDLRVGAAPVSEGYLPLVLRKFQLETEQRNVEALGEYLKLFQAYSEGGEIAPLQVGQVELQLLQGRSTVLQRAQDLRDGQDRFNLQLGLPVNMPLDLDDAEIRPIRAHLDRFETVFAQFKSAVDDIFEDPPIDRPEEKQGEAYFLKNPKELRGRIRVGLTASRIVQGTDFQRGSKHRDPIDKRLDSWSPAKLDDKGLFKRLDELGKKRRALLAKKTDLEIKGQQLSEDEITELQRVESERELGRLEEQLRIYEAQPWKKEAKDKDREKVHGALFRDLRNRFAFALSDARFERLGQLYQRWPPLPLVEIAGQSLLPDPRLLKTQGEREQAFDQALTRTVQTALTNRLDLMNQRAQVTDAWRQVAIFANSLLGAFNVEYHMSSTTPAGQAKPLAFTGSRSRHQLVLNAELPLVRKAERNNYRASLIAYQRERRSLMAAEDRIAAAVRSELRQLRLLAENYEIQQKAVDTAYSQVESALETFRAPPDPKDAARGAAGTAAALTQQLLQAQDRLVRTQNQLYALWTNYQTTRLQLYLDLELMALDSRGVWIDEFTTRRTCPDDGRPDDRSGQSQPATQRLGQPERLTEPRPFAPTQGAPLEP